MLSSPVKIMVFASIITFLLLVISAHVYPVSVVRNVNSIIDFVNQILVGIMVDNTEK
jgi:hypothetical protein